MANINKNNPIEQPFIYFDDDLTRNAWIQSQNLPFQRAGQYPATNIIETHQDFILEIALPGIDPEEVTINIDEKGIEIVYLGGSEAYLQGNQRHWVVGHAPRPFRRRFEFHAGSLKFSEIEMEYEFGVLHILIPKAEEDQGRLLSAYSFSES